MAAVYPQVWLQIAGVNIPCITGSASRKSKRASDTFSCTFSAARAASLGLGYNFWADFQPQDATLIMASLAGGSDARPMVTGQGDEPEIDWLAGTIRFSTRDKSAQFVESKVQQKYLNQASSDIVSQIASNVGLTPAVQSTPSFAGVQYNQDTAHLAPNKSAWQVLDDLADREGYRWYVDGSSLYFEPDDQSNGAFQVFYQPPAPGQPASGNLNKLVTRRDMTAARTHQVTVKGWHHRLKQQFQDVETAQGVGDPVIHEHHHNMRTQQQVQTLAQSRLKNAIRHDMQVSIEMPGDLTCDVRQTLSLMGTGTIYDQSYDIDSVDWEIEWGSGFNMTIEAKSPKAGRSASSSSGSGSGSGGNPAASNAAPSESTNVGPGPGGGEGYGTNGAAGSAPGVGTGASGIGGGSGGGRGTIST